MKDKICMALTVIFVMLSMLFTPACSNSDDDQPNGAKVNITQPEAIDLGLSVKWADRNIGAEQTWDYGYYFAWGETTPKTMFTDSTYKFFNHLQQEYRKYNSEDNLTVLEKEDDAARVLCGKKWRMPTLEDFEELISETKWTYKVVRGVGGFKVTGPNKKSIFIPASGFYGENEITWRYGTSSDPRIYLWSSSASEEYAIGAYGLEISQNYAESINYGHFQYGIEDFLRYIGLPIRSVCDE